MSNKNYLAGRAFEYETREAWRKLGYTVLRTAGSHGEFDLVAYKWHTPVVMIQCKRTEDAATGKRLCQSFQKNPPIPPGAASFQQHLAVKIVRQGTMGVTV